MKLESVEIENYRAIDCLRLSFDPSLTVLHGDNAHGKTSVLNAIAVGLGVIPTLLPGVSGIKFLKRDRRRTAPFVHVGLTTTDGVTWSRRVLWHPREDGLLKRSRKLGLLKEKLDEIIRAEQEGRHVELPIVAFYDTDRAVVDRPGPLLAVTSNVSRFSDRYSALQDALSSRTSFRGLFQWLYKRLINDDKGESGEALELRRALEERSPEDPALGRADIEIRYPPAAGGRPGGLRATDRRG